MKEHTVTSYKGFKNKVIYTAELDNILDGLPISSVKPTLCVYGLWKDCSNDALPVDWDKEKELDLIIKLGFDEWYYSTLLDD